MNQPTTEQMDAHQAATRQRVIAAGRQPGQRTYRVTIKCDGTLPDDPYFAGRTGNAYPDFTCVVWAFPPDENCRSHPAGSVAWALHYPYPLRGEQTEEIITEIEEG